MRLRSNEELIKRRATDSKDALRPNDEGLTHPGHIEDHSATWQLPLRDEGAMFPA